MDNKEENRGNMNTNEENRWTVQQAVKEILSARLNEALAWIEVHEVDNRWLIDLYIRAPLRTLLKVFGVLVGVGLMIVRVIVDHAEEIQALLSGA